MKKIIALLLLCAVVGAGFYGYKQHKRSELIATLTPLVKNASIRVTNSAKLATGSSNITFKELFDRLEADTAEIEKRNIDIQSLSTSDTAPITGPIENYMRDCQEFSRAMSLKYRKRLAFTSSLEAVEDATRDMRTSSSYGFEYAKKRSDLAVERMDKAGKDAQEAIIDFATAAKNLKQSRAKLAMVLPEDALVPVAQLEPLMLKEDPKSNGAKAEKAAVTR